MPSRRALLAGLAAGLLAACGTPVTSPSPTPTPTVSTPTPDPADAAAVKAFLARTAGGIAGLRTLTAEVIVTSAEDPSRVVSESSVEMDRRDPGQTRMRATTRVSAGELEVIAVDGRFYVRLSTLGDAWWQAGEERVKELGGALATQDSIATWQFFEQHFLAVEAVGEEEIDQVPTRRYLATVDSAAMEVFTGEPATEETFVLDLWLDAANRPRRSVATMVSGEEKFVVQTTFGNFGRPLQIEAPSADSGQLPE